jgi:hypothetical protein
MRVTSTLESLLVFQGLTANLGIIKKSVEFVMRLIQWQKPPTCSPTTLSLQNQRQIYV